jgi:3-oxoacyl-[acyl-carrier protein] reductase
MTRTLAMKDRFKGKNVVVTGGASGIGKAIAQRFLDEGARVLIFDLNRENLAATSKEFAAGKRLTTCVGDVSKRADVERMLKIAERTFGQIHVLISNAGIAAEHDFLKLPPRDWDRILAVNLTGMIHCGQVVARHMASRGGGVIVNMASKNGLVGECLYAAYNASKGGVVMLTRTMALDLAKHNIRVNAVCPGYILTSLAEKLDDPAQIRRYVGVHVPMRRTGTPEEVAGVFAFLASDDASFMTGECVVVDGGQSVDAGSHQKERG